MMKRLLSLLLTLSILLGAMPGLAETAVPVLHYAEIASLKALAGDAQTGATWHEGMSPSASMNALQMWQWTDWFLSEKLRSLLGSAQDYIQLASGLPDSSLSTLEWELREREDQLTYYEEQLSDGRMAILNGIRLYQDVSASAYDRARAYDRMMEAKEEILQAIKRGAGNDMPVIYRISMDHRIPGGRTLEDSKRLIKILGENGVDAFDVDCGCYEHPDFVYPTFYRGDACMEYVCDTAREATDKPILNSGNHTPQTAKHLIESGRADFAMMGRPLIADPYLPKKLMENREEDVRPCIRCNEECIGRIWGRYSKLSCAVNPQANEEHAFRIVKTETPKNVVVIGGGPGGMEAARVAALKGNHVTLYERNELGGTLNLPAQAQFKTRLKALIEYYKTQMRKLGVTVVHQEIDIDSPVLAAADKIIAATGAHSVVPPIPGAHGANVIDIKDAHRDPAAIKGKKIAICGGGLSGSDFALEMATEYGKQCTIIEMKPDVAMDMVFINQHSLKIYLKDAGVVTRTNTRVSEIVENGVCVINEHGEQELIEADVVVAAFGMAPNTELTNALKQKYNKKLVCVGDCVEVGKSGKAIRGGFYAGMQID